MGDASTPTDAVGLGGGELGVALGRVGDGEVGLALKGIGEEEVGIELNGLVDGEVEVAPEGGGGRVSSREDPKGDKPGLLLVTALLPLGGEGLGGRGGMVPAAVCGDASKPGDAAVPAVGESVGDCPRVAVPSAGAGNEENVPGDNAACESGTGLPEVKPPEGGLLPAVTSPLAVPGAPEAAP
ncbi:hypothetical protein ABBQ38_003669 [Trebouxia sp. C0009 RCD-2024]